MYLISYWLILYSTEPHSILIIKLLDLEIYFPNFYLVYYFTKYHINQYHKNLHFYLIKDVHF
jgi:hypothetical protein